MVACVICLPTLAAAQTDPSHICDHAAQTISRETGVPRDVLLAVTLTETGRSRGGTVRPWPWTVNMEGKGIWFETEDDARAYVYQHFKQGARSFDVGCFQLNYKWHHQGFSSIDEMFDPLAGGRYAAGFLTELYQEKGDWTEAAGAYHSRTLEHAERYMARFKAHRETISTRGAPPPPPADIATNDPGTMTPVPKRPVRPRINTFPLLQTGTDARTASPGSLVPLEQRPDQKGLIDFNDAG